MGQGLRHVPPGSAEKSKQVVQSDPPCAIFTPMGVTMAPFFLPGAAVVEGEVAECEASSLLNLRFHRNWRCSFGFEVAHNALVGQLPAGEQFIQELGRVAYHHIVDEEPLCREG